MSGDFAGGYGFEDALGGFPELALKDKKRGIGTNRIYSIICKSYAHEMHRILEWII